MIEWIMITIRNACISLCVQSPSSPSNPSVSICGVEAFVEQLYKIFIEYHLIAEESAEIATIPAVPPCMFMQYFYHHHHYNTIITFSSSTQPSRITH